jgi:hypothetical protein
MRHHLTLICMTGLLAAGSLTAEDGLQKAIDQAMHRVERVDGAYRTFNPEQRLDARFAATGTEFLHRGHHFRVVLEGLGQPGELIARDNRVEMRRRSVTEWYVNSKEGLEHGFTLAHKQGPVRLRLAVTGEYQPAMEGGAVVLREPGTQKVALRYGGLQSWDADGRTLPSRAEVEGNQIHLVVDDAGAKYPVTVDPVFQEAAVTAPGGQAADQFGYSIAVSADTAVVGAPYVNSASNFLYQGAVYVFGRTNGVWTWQQTLTGSATVYQAGFGWSVAISGDTIVVGAPYEGGGLPFEGAVYAFTRAGGVWTEQQRIPPPIGSIGLLFGTSVAIDGDTLIAGAPPPVVPTGPYVFVRSGGQWSLQGTLAPGSEVNSPQYVGTSVSISGDTAVVGAISGKPAGRPTFGGFVEVWTRSGSLWSRQAVLQYPETPGGDNWQFGQSVAVSGDTLLVGSPGAFQLPHDRAYVFTRSGSLWLYQATLAPSDLPPGSLFGTSVALTGDVAVVGAPNAASGTGAAYLYFRNGTAWTERRLTQAAPLPPGIGYGTSVAIGGGYALAGAPNANSRQGEFYSFRVQNVTIQSSPSGQSFTLSGSGCGGAGAYTTPYSGLWSNCSVQWATPLAGANTRSAFTGWSDGSSLNPRNMIMIADPTQSALNLTGLFRTEYLLTTQAIPISGGTATGDGWYTAGSTAGVTATPNPGFTFAGFSGGLTGTVTPRLTVMNGPKTVTANFAMTPPATMTGVVSAKAGNSNNRQWTISLTNNGPGIAYGAQVFVLAFAQTFGTTCTSLPVRLSPVTLPGSIGTLNVGQSAGMPITLDFTGCPANARFTVNIGYMSNGGASGGQIQLVNQFQ